MRLPWRARGISAQPAPKPAEQEQQTNSQQKAPDMSVYSPGGNEDYWKAYNNKTSGTVNSYGGKVVSWPIGEPPPPEAYGYPQSGGSSKSSPGQSQPTQPQDSGRARPVPPPAQGTPYGYPAYSLEDWQAPAPPAQVPGYSSTPASTYTARGYMESGPYGGNMNFGGPSDYGNFAYAPIDQRPEPFTAQYQGFDGSVSDKPNYGQRDAFIQQANDMMMPYYSGKSQGAPQMNVQDMWSNAGKMVENGYQNPFAPPAQQMPSLADYLAQYAPQMMYSQNNYYE
jgi:hypothetical protein